MELNDFSNFFWGIGYFGWQLSSLYALYVCYKHGLNYLLLALLFLVSMWINKELKQWIMEPRPSMPISFLSSDQIPLSYGMPSGHAQQTVLALNFAYLLTRKYLWSSIALTLMVCIYSFMFNRHTIPQLMGGGMVGFLLGNLSFVVIK